jgi:hypothetical protein
MKTGTLMLVALVASLMEPPKDNPKFVDYIPKPRKKRKYWK